MSASGETSLASLDGEIMPAAEAAIPATDDGLIRGDGAFEVVRVYDGTLFKLDAHLARLKRSSENLRLPVDLEAVSADAYRLVAEAYRNPADAADHQQLRIVCTRGGRRLLLTEPLPEKSEKPSVRLKSITYAPTLILDGIKSLSYGANMQASRLAREAGADEALLVTPEGIVLEAPTSTLFWVIDDRLVTTPLDTHVLASITRAMIFDSVEAHEGTITLDELYAAQECFLASTTREVLPVSAIDDHEYPAPGPVSERTLTAVQARIASELSAA